MNWITHIPDLSGKTALVTGGTGGIGLETARALARAGAQVIITGRDEGKGQSAERTLRKELTDDRVQFMTQDLSNLQDIQRSANLISERHQTLDILINNAGVMWLKESRSVDGHDMQLATNHFGHFALTLHLLPILMAAPASRIVTVSSIAHTKGKIHFDNLNLEGEYGRQKAYSQSKLANLFFAFELDRRLKSIGSSARSVACHPGVASTDLAVPGLGKITGNIVRFLTPLVAQSARHGAQPSLLAATGRNVMGGDFYGPRYYTMGPATKTRARSYAYHENDARLLWEISEKLTGTHFP